MERSRDGRERDTHLKDQGQIAIGGSPKNGRREGATPETTERKEMEKNLRKKKIEGMEMPDAGKRSRGDEKRSRVGGKRSRD
jgi:hypothetical protein